MLSGGFAHLFPWNPYFPNVPVKNPNPSVVHFTEQTDENAPPVLGISRLNPHPLPQVALTMIQSQERPIHSRGRHFESIPPRHEVVNVKEISKLSMDSREVIQGYTSLTIECETQHPTSTFLA
jgi:hypothetical protein